LRHPVGVVDSGLSGLPHSRALLRPELRASPMDSSRLHSLGLSARAVSSSSASASRSSSLSRPRAVLILPVKKAAERSTATTAPASVYGSCESSAARVAMSRRRNGWSPISYAIDLPSRTNHAIMRANAGRSMRAFLTLTAIPAGLAASAARVSMSEAIDRRVSRTRSSFDLK
jgi:hypothetical protein